MGEGGPGSPSKLGCLGIWGWEADRDTGPAFGYPEPAVNVFCWYTLAVDNPPSFWFLQISVGFFSMAGEWSPKKGSETRATCDRDSKRPLPGCEAWRPVSTWAG